MTEPVPTMRHDDVRWEMRWSSLVFMLALSASLVTGTPAAAAAPPGPPTAAAATPGDGQAAVTWKAPADNGGEPVSTYTVTSTPGAQSCTTSTLGCTVAGLTNGTSYTFTVTAANSAGPGPASAPSAPVTPRTVPGAPTGVTGTAGDARVVVAWRAPASNGGDAISLYVATASPGGATCRTRTALSCTVTGLTNGQAYTFTVTAANAAGTGSASAASDPVTPKSAPGAPTGLTGTPGNASVTLTWTAPASTGGTPITRYRVVAAPGGRACSVTTLTCQIRGLTNGQSYTFRVRATNSVGTGAYSAPTQGITPMTVPGPVTQLTASRTGTRKATLNWNAPASNGGDPITGYIVTSNPDGLRCTTSATGCVITDLTPGTSYRFSVVATNSAGQGATATSNQVKLPKRAQSAKLRTAKRVKYKGKTVLVKEPVVTNAGQTADVTVTVNPAGKRYARVQKKASGRVVIRTKGKRTLRVTVTASAPATSEFKSYAQKRTWRVSR